MDKDLKRIDKGESLLGVGLVVTDYLSEELSQGEEGAKIIVKPLERGEDANYDGRLEELRIISENENFILACVKYYFPFDKKEEGEYWTFENEEIVLMLELDLEDSPPDLHDAKKIGKTFRDLSKYLDLPIKELCFFFYFPEKIMINCGIPYVSIEDGNGWEPIEEFGEQDFE